MGLLRRSLALAVMLAAGAAGPQPAHAYEFEVSARTIAQIFDRHWIRIGPNPVLGVRRFTELLSLDLWDLAGARPGRPRVYFNSHLRIDHDFGEWTGGRITFAGPSGFPCGQTCEAIDLIPELENGAVQIDLLYGYLGVDDLAGGLVDLKLGRQLRVDALDWWSFDGASVQVDTPWHVSVEAMGGLAVRESSLLGSPTFELDGTSGGQCEEYVEAGMVGLGDWRLPFRDTAFVPDRFRNDLDEDWCPQRDEPMPTWGAAVQSRGLGWLSARASYRRTMSSTVGIVHPDQDPPDRGWYPNEISDFAPDRAVNQELVAATARAVLSPVAGRWQLVPHAEGRYSLLHGRIDEAGAGVQVTWRSHVIEPQVYYSYPTFDGDSIFNVFSASPHRDLQLSYDLAPRGARWRTFARVWMREYQTEDSDEAEAGATVASRSYSTGAKVGGQWRFAADRSARLDLFHEAGYGGRRSGGMGAARWRLRRSIELTGRLSAISFDEDLQANLKGTSLGAQAGATWVINAEGVAAHLLAEENTSPVDRSQWRVIGVLDLAFQPEIP